MVQIGVDMIGSEGSLNFFTIFWNCSMSFGCRRGRSQSCPYCRDSLRRVNSGDLWIFTDSADIEDVDKITRDNLQRLFLYIDKLPLLISESVFALYESYETHLKWWASLTSFAICIGFLESPSSHSCYLCKLIKKLVTGVGFTVQKRSGIQFVPSTPSDRLCITDGFRTKGKQKRSVNMICFGAC